MDCKISIMFFFHFWLNGSHLASRANKSYLGSSQARFCRAKSEQGKTEARTEPSQAETCLNPPLDQVCEVCFYSADREADGQKGSYTNRINL